VGIDILTHIKPELLLTIPPALNVIGSVLKSKHVVHGKGIQFVLMAISIVLTLMYVLGTSDLSTYQDWVLATFFSITQGATYASAAIGVHQVCNNDEEHKKGSEA
jgi:hypothetical protein